jgi:hypothetical protein
MVVRKDMSAMAEEADKQPNTNQNNTQTNAAQTGNQQNANQNSGLQSLDGSVYYDPEFYRPDHSFLIEKADKNRGENKIIEAIQRGTIERKEEKKD